MAKLDTIVGMEFRSIELLRAANVRSVEHLLKAGGTPDGRRVLSEKTGLRLKMISSWVIRADLARITGIGGEYADLLHRIKISSVPELAVQEPHDVCERLQLLNKSKRLVRRVPSLSFVTQWISEAQELPTLITL